MERGGRRGMSRKSLYRWSVLVAFFFAIGFTYQYHLPQIETWLLVKLEDFASKKAPAQIIPSRLKLTLFPLGVVLEDIRIIPKKGLDRTLAPTDIKELALGVNVWSLVRGEIRLSRVIVRDSTVTVFLKPELFEKAGGGGSNSSGKKMNLDAVKDLPVDEFILENMTIMGRMDPQHVVFRITSLDLDIVNLYNSLYLYFGSPSWQFKPAGPFPTLNFEAQGRGLFDAGEVRISALKIKSGDSFLVASGLLSGDLTDSQLSTGRFSARTHLELGDIASWMRVLPNPPQLPALSGLLNVNADIAYRRERSKA